MYLDLEIRRYGVKGRLLLHDGISTVTGRHINPLQVDVHEIVRVEWRENAALAAALRMQSMYSRCQSEWLGKPHVWRYVEPHQEPPDQVLRWLGAPTLPGMD